ncbi:PAS domain S-box protein [Chloroflexota bacterium]
METQPMPKKSKGGYLEALLNSCPSAIMAINTDGIITFANKETCNLIGCNMDGLIGESIASVYESPELARETNRKMYMGGGIVHDHESRMKAKTGKIVPVRVSAAHLKDSTGKYAGAVGYFEKYRPWTTAETNLKAYAEELEAKLEEWKDLGAPVFELYPGLTALVIVGRLDTSRFERATANLLEHIKRVKTQVVLIDLSAALLDDDKVANQLMKTMRTAHLLGAQSIVAGMQSSLAQAMEPLIVDLSSIKSYYCLEVALEEALRILGFEICKKD